MRSDVANLSIESVETLQETSNLLVKAYEDVKYEGASGKLNRVNPFFLDKTDSIKN